jgi:hypothetical protein
MPLAQHPKSMKKIHHYAIALIVIAIVLFLWKIFPNDSKVKPTNAPSGSDIHEADDSNFVESNNIGKKILQTPKGTLRYAEVKPSYDMVSRFIDLDLIDADYQQRLARLRPDPWKVFLDDNNHVVKFQIREVVLPTLNNDLAGLDIMEQWYIITEIGTNKISMDDKETMKNLYLSIQLDNSFLDNNTQEFSGGPNLQEVEMYPVIAQYQGIPYPELRNSDKNFAYLQGKDLPMILIKSNKGYPHKDDWNTASEEGRKLLNKYGMKECREIEWLLLPFPRNEEEVKFFANAPNPDSIGTAATRYTPTVKAWERVHGKKYVGP